MEEDITLPEKLLGLLQENNIDPDDISHINEALTHPSYANEHNIPSNERLEFLGDAVIELITRGYLYDKHPDYSEGDLTQIKVRIVSRDGLSFLAERIELGSVILFGRNESLRSMRKNSKVLTQAMESLMGAIYLSCGFDKARGLFTTILDEQLTELLDRFPHLDPKSRLQIISQDMYDTLPDYYTFEVEMGFVSEVFIDDEKVGEGTGRSKREAEMSSARDALERLSGEI